MESDTRWVSTDLQEDEFRLLSRLVVDFARNVGLAEAQDDDLLQLVIAAYLAGRSRDWTGGPPSRGWTQ
jgi:hypothetical protein